MGHDRLQQIMANLGFRTRRHAHHQTLTWTINVGIQQPNAPAFRCQGQGQIGRDSGFTHAAFAGCDRYHLFYARQNELLYC